MSSCPERRRPLLAAALRGLAPSQARARATLRAVGLALILAGSAATAWAQAQSFPGVGRAATPKEVAAWDIDVRPDFKGLPRGAGSVAKGQQVWEAQCASCHGIFGESNEVFSPLIGGTTADDIRSGRVARLTDEAFPGRTTMMKLSSLSTLWDYINRAMPWTNPKTLTTEEVYAVTAFMLNLADVVPEDFTLSHENIAQVQQRLPNRNGKTTDHAMWPGRSMGKVDKPDVQGTACMANCATEPRVASLLPDHARNAHGNLAEQQRGFGAQVGVDTTRPAGAPRVMPTVAAAAAPAAAADPATTQALALARQHNCMVCHGVDNKIVGPGLTEVARKYAGRSDAAEYLAQRIRAGGTGVWGAIPMPEQSLPAEDARTIAKWLAAGAGKQP